MNKNKYPIFEDRVYTLSYNDENGKMDYEVAGSEILAMFRRQAFLDKLISGIEPSNLHNDMLDDLREL